MEIDEEQNINRGVLEMDEHDFAAWTKNICNKSAIGNHHPDNYRRSEKVKNDINNVNKVLINKKCKNLNYLKSIIRETITQNNYEIKKWLKDEYGIIGINIENITESQKEEYLIKSKR